MEKALWYLFAGSRGGETRARIVNCLHERPYNANRIAEQVGLEYNTVRYHLEVLEDNGVVERSSDEYGALYFLTDRFDAHRNEYDEVTEHL